MIELEGIDDVYCFERESSNERRIMSVTSVARRTGLVRFFVSPEQLAELATFGRDVHMICEDVARGGVPDYWSELPQFVPYAEAFAKFVRDFDFVPEFIEEKMIDERIGYLGKLDLAGIIFASSKSRRRRAVIEIKKGVRAGWHAVQTAAYKNLLEVVKGWKDVDRYCIYLPGDGNYKPIKHPDPIDWSRFLALLTTARLREEWKLVSSDEDADFDRIVRGETAGRRIW